MTSQAKWWRANLALPLKTQRVLVGVVEVKAIDRTDACKTLATLLKRHVRFDNLQPCMKENEE